MANAEGAGAHGGTGKSDCQSPHTLMTSQNDNTTHPMRATLLERKIAQAADGRLATAEYYAAQVAAVDRIATLKALRLARDITMVKPTAKTNKSEVKPKAKTRKAVNRR